jgi:NADP-dependent 3-hydroxy acid dehydrogenase YdfG
MHGTNPTAAGANWSNKIVVITQGSGTGFCAARRSLERGASVGCGGSGVDALCSLYAELARSQEDVRKAAV